MKKLLIPLLLLLLLLPAATAKPVAADHETCMSFALQMLDWCIAGSDGSEHSIIVCSQFSAQIYYNCMELPAE